LWRGHPDIVSKGAQKNFAYFAHAIGKEWAKQPDTFNEAFYRHAIAKAIIFRRTEKLVTDQPWYEGGYRANVVAYAIAKIGHDVDRLKRAVDFDGIWRGQGISESIEEALIIAAKAAHDVIVDPPAGIRNVTEWAKQQACWSRVSALKIDWPSQFLEDLIMGEEQRATRKSAVKQQKMLNGIEAQTAVVNAGGEFWKNVKEWGSIRRLLTPAEAGILDVAATVPARLPTEKQSLKTIETLKKLHAEVCQIGLELT